MKRISFAIAVIIIISGCTEYRGESINERIEWTHSWITNTADTVLPRVLIIGDSHVENYYQHISKALKDKANACKFTTSKSLGDPILSDQIELVLKQYDFDIITFNNGLHGRKYSEEQYGEHLPELIGLIQSLSDAEIILINTTPARKSGNLEEFQDFNTKVIARNSIFEDYASRNGLPLVNLYSLGEKSTDYYRNDGIHFNPEGVKEEARLVTDAIEKLL
jgi:lysophospholipase L1-like esterase